MVRRPDGSFGFTDCDYVAKYNTTCQNHIESKHLLKIMVPNLLISTENNGSKLVNI